MNVNVAHLVILAPFLHLGDFFTLLMGLGQVLETVVRL